MLTAVRSAFWHTFSPSLRQVTPSLNTMEFAEAGLDDWPPSSSFVGVPMSSLRRDLSATPVNHEKERRRVEKAEKRRRKELRAAHRAAKQARREEKERRKSSSDVAREQNTALEEEDKEVLIPPSGQTGVEAGNEFALSVSPEKEDAAIQADANKPTASQQPHSASPRESSTPRRQPVVELPSRKRARSTSQDTYAIESAYGVPDRATYLHDPSRANAASPNGDTLSNKKSLSKPVKTKKASRPSTEINGNGNAEPGPSTPRPSTKKKVRRASSAAPSSSAKARVRPDDDELRAQLTNSAAMNEYLASRFYPVAHINRLEAAGILRIRKGKFDEKEIAAVRRHLGIFRQTYRLDEEQLVEIIMAKGKGNARETYPDFWQNIAHEVPGRPLRYVVKQIQRMYDPRGRKGPWTASEDNELIRAHKVHPGEWTKIAAVVERTEQDCRDRWQKELAYVETRNTGTWAPEEEARLLRIINQINDEIGTPGVSLEAPWDLVSAKMNHQRGPTQCRVKWQREMYPKQLGTWRTPPGKRKPNRKPTLNFKSQEFVESDLESEDGGGHELEDIEVDPSPAIKADDIEADSE